MNQKQIWNKIAPEWYEFKIKLSEHTLNFLKNKTGKILDLGWDGKMIGHIRIFSTHDYHVALSVLSIYVFLSIVSAIFIKETKAKQLV